MIHSDQKFTHPGSGQRHTYRLRLRAGIHDWRFVYTSGDESGIIEAITAMARDPRCALNWASATRLLRAIGSPAAQAPPSQGSSSTSNTTRGFGEA